MTGYLEPTTTQMVRQTLHAMDVRVPPTAGSAEVVRSLVRRVRCCADDPALLATLMPLIDALDAGRDPERLPDPGCETVDARALADELHRLLDPRAAAGGGHAGAPVTLVAVAGLLVGVAMQSGCDYKPPAPGCLDDVSTEGFTAMVEECSDCSAGLIDDSVDRFEDLDASEQEDVIAELCSMRPGAIAAYLESNFGEDGDDDDWADDDVAYKGVTF